MTFFFKHITAKKALSIIIFCIAISSQAQSLSEAKRLYGEGMFIEAMPAFEKLVKRSPSNGSYNHWYGVCCYETGDYATSIAYLKTGVKRKVQESGRYLAEAYFALYQFNDAIKAYEDYIDLITKKSIDTTPFEHRLEVAKQAARMMEHTEAVQVIDSLLISKSRFLESYQLSEEAGYLTSANSFFSKNSAMKTALDDTFSLLYMNQKKDKIYYSERGDDDRMQITTQSKLLDKWGDKKHIRIHEGEDHVNEICPFMLSDGATLYFASTSKESIGGYDLFITRYNTQNEKFLNPEQLSMPFNSIANDYMMVVDEVKNLGWFVSDRFQTGDTLCVYLFIPNPDRDRVQTDSLQLRLECAMARPIQSTWEDDANTNYQLLRDLAYKTIPFGAKQPKHDFTFVVNDKTVYYQLEDFKNQEARRYMEQLLATQNKNTALNRELDQQRMTYAKEKSQQKKNDMKIEILNNEKQLETLATQSKGLEKKIRQLLNGSI